MRAATWSARAGQGQVLAPLALNAGHGSAAGIVSLLVASPAFPTGAVNLEIEAPNISSAPAYGGVATGGAWRRRVDAPSAINKMPPMRADQYGHYFDFSTEGARSILTGPGPWGWDPAAAGGYQSLTKMVVARLVVSGGPYQAFYVTGDPTEASRAWLGVAGTTAYVDFRTGNIAAYFTGGALIVGDPYCVIFTSRSTTNHEIVLRNLKSGAVSATTNTANSGTGGAAPTYSSLGARSSAGEYLVNGRIYQAAMWARGMSRAEMLELARDPAGLYRQTRVRTFLSAAPASVTGDLAVTLDDATLAATGVVPVVGTFAVTLDDAALAAEGTVPLSGTLAVTLDDAGLYSYAQVGEGVVGGLGELAITLDDATLDATGTLSVIGDAAVSLDDATLAAFAVSGTNGPFARRRMMVLNG